MEDSYTLEDYRRMADEGNLDAIYVLATRYRNGDGVEMDKAKAAELYRKAADMGDSDSQYDLAFMLDGGEGIECDREEAERYFKMSADQGDTDACLCYAGSRFEKEDYPEAERYFLTAAMKGDVKAQYNLGLMYMGEYLGAPDMAKAREWFEISAGQGFAYSQSMLGTMLIDEGDLEAAELFFREAAKQGEPTAMYNLGGLGLSNQIKMDYREAIEWMTKAASAGYEPAYQVLLRLNAQGPQ